jgi:hypothetical protein
MGEVSSSSVSCRCSNVAYWFDRRGSIFSDNALDHSYLDPVEFSDLVDGHSVTRQRSNAIVLRSRHLGPPPDYLSS